ncbi:hypothetical protein [Aestuariimicrobium sp. Y1814]|uniref:hypothetical protein n=1 Tax=Aestuariimicrobium sp. Y1814 TaxID=3418742 RepID=UPI003DA722EE
MRIIPKMGVPLVALALALAGCGQSQDPAADPTTSSPVVSPSHDEHDEHDHDEHDHESSDGKTQEVGARAPRLALTHSAGVMVVDAEKLTVISDIPLEGFLRLRPTGDARYPLVDVAGTSLKTLDLGSWTEAHGDHGHSKITEPSLTGTSLTTQKAGHVSTNAGLTAIFDDGDGSIEVFETKELAHADATPVRTLTVAPHHGNAIPLADGKLLHTTVSGEVVNGIRILDAEDKVLAESAECPGLHGSAIAKDAIVIGCQDGALVVKGETITKVKAGPAFARIGNLFGSTDSPYVLGDYKQSADAKPTQVAIINTTDASISTVDLPAAYTFRGLAFTDEGQALVLTNDGQLHVIEADHGHIHASIKVLDPFTEPDDWQQPRPTIHAQGHWVYVTDPANKKVHAVELSVAKVMATGELPQAPNEVAGTLG